MSLRVVHVVGARPNFMKVAPVRRALGVYADVEQVLVHTGQHYDANMSAVFFSDLGMPAPDVNLEVRSGTHAQQVAAIMTRLETFIQDGPRADMVIVYGDVNSTLAAALVCAKLLVPLAHVEAGLRSFDRTMPEEVNRIVTDRLADLLLTPSGDGNENLAGEGVPAERVHLVGNVMIDTLVRLLPRARERWGALARPWHLEDGDPYAVVTLHRPSNVDDVESLGRILDALVDLARHAPVIFPVHPRTRARLDGLAFDRGVDLRLVEPMGYLDFLALQSHARLVITDSGGLQEESTWLGVRCLTLRENTERPITVTGGTNTLVGGDMEKLRGLAREALETASPGPVPVLPLWDGAAGQRVAQATIAACRKERPRS